MGSKVGISTPDNIPVSLVTFSLLDTGSVTGESFVTPSSGNDSENNKQTC